MRRSLLVAFLWSTGACSLLTNTDGLSGGPNDGGGGGAVDGAAPIVEGGASDTCVGAGCVAPPIPACDGPCVPALIATETELEGLAADESGVYWTAPAGGDIKRADVEGKLVVTLFDGKASPRQLALDDTFVYWTESNSGSVSAVRKDVVLGPRTTLTGFANVLAIAVSNGEVFLQLRDNGEVRRAPTSLTTSSLLTKQPIGQVLALAADPQNVYLGVTSVAINRVRRAPRSGPTAEPVDLTTAGSDLRGFAIDATRAYVADGDLGRVTSEKLDGSGGFVTHASGEARPSAVAVDDTHVYWTAEDGGLVRRVAKAGGMPETLASGQTGPFAIAVNSRAVYWLNTNGTVMTVRKP